MNERHQRYISTTALIILFVAFLMLADIQYLMNEVLNEALQLVNEMKAELELIEAQQRQVEKLYNEVNQIREYIQLRRPQATEKEAWETAAYILHYSKKYNVDPKVVVAMAAQESSFDRNALGALRERGMLQILPSTFRGYGYGDIHDWRNTLEAGVKYYKMLEKRYGGNVTLAVSAYNAGMGNVTDHIPEIPVTQRHVARVMTAYRGMRR